MPRFRQTVLVPVAVLIGFLVGCGGDDDKDSGEGPLDSLVSAAKGDYAPDTSGVSKDLAGDWSGQLTQAGLPPFEVAVRFDPGRAIRVAYTGINCGGSWHWNTTLESNPPFYIFDERINQGEGDECKGTGSVEIHPKEPCRQPLEGECGYETLRYEFEGGGVKSKGTLTRTDPEGLGRIFEEAGVDPPD